MILLRSKQRLFSSTPFKPLPLPMSEHPRRLVGSSTVSIITTGINESARDRSARTVQRNYLPRRRTVGLGLYGLTQTEEHSHMRTYSTYYALFHLPRGFAAKNNKRGLQKNKKKRENRDPIMQAGPRKVVLLYLVRS